MQTNPAVEQSKIIGWSEIRVISPVGKEEVYGEKDLQKSQVLSSESNTERVREDTSGDSEDSEVKLRTSTMLNAIVLKLQEF